MIIFPEHAQGILAQIDAANMDYAIMEGIFHQLGCVTAGREQRKPQRRREAEVFKRQEGKKGLHGDDNLMVALIG
ncbi:hypothetical protein [Collimonas humicola]|uniref:hypothetical protein n=1 Tax=Collimonas humicola TaxID=2825886 RepID=UPI001B8BB910|nr:hypothetical protein [Collimonas humicola]